LHPHQEKVKSLRAFVAWWGECESRKDSNNDLKALFCG